MTTAACDHLSASAPSTRDTHHPWRCSAVGGEGGSRNLRGCLRCRARVQSLPHPSGSQPASQLGRRRRAPGVKSVKVKGAAPHCTVRGGALSNDKASGHSRSYRGACKSPPPGHSVPLFPPEQAGCCCCDRLVTKSRLTLCHPMDCSPPGSSIHGISQERTLEWVAISSSRGSSRSRD